MNRKIRKIKKQVRRMEWWERSHLMDWLNAWYAAELEQQRMEEE